MRTIGVAAIKEQQVDVDRYSSRVGFGNDVTEDMWKYIFTYIPKENMSETERGISIMLFNCWTAHEIWDIEEAELEKTMHQSYLPKNYDSFSKNTTPTSNIVRHRKSSAVNLSLVPEAIFGMKIPQKWGLDTVRSGLLNMSDQEKMEGQIFWRTCFGEN